MRAVLTDVRRHDSNITRDISLMALDKLWALLPLEEVVDAPNRRAALNDRLVKAWIDAAVALIRAGRRSDGLKHYAAGLSRPGCALRKLKGTARIGYELVTSLGAGRPRVMHAAIESPIPADAAWQTRMRRRFGSDRKDR